MVAKSLTSGRRQRTPLTRNVGVRGAAARLKRDLARYDARITTLQHQLDSLKTYADSLDRDRAYFEAAAAQARARRAMIEQRLRDLEARSTRPTDSPVATP